MAEVQPRRVDPFRLLGASWVIAGGLVAAVTGPLSLENGSWAAAFSVLVAGVAQYAIGVVQREVAPRPPSQGIVAMEVVAWNTGCLTVIIGTVISMPLVVDAGGLLLVFSLALMVLTARGGGTGPMWALWTYRILLFIMLVSIPIGLTLAHLRNG